MTRKPKGETAGARAAFLAEACGDDAALRAEVEPLAQAESSPSFFEPAMFGAASSPSLVGPHLGAYRVDAPIGAGGMGDVRARCFSAPSAITFRARESRARAWLQ